jgi:aryl-alcohol dehydrogenase-like predicted oxidoreductase
MCFPAGLSTGLAPEGLGDEEATERPVRDGKIGYVGSSNFAGWHPPRGAKAPTFPRVVTEQSIHKANDAN